MILRKPYAFFIKIFKPMHIFMSVLIVFLIYKTNNILSFLNQYIYSNESVIGKPIREMLISKELFIIPILMIVLLYNNKKGKSLKYLFYVFYPLQFLILYFLNMVI